MRVLFILLLSVSSSFSQNWELQTIKDEFGDPTDEKRYIAKVMGTFNNSAQTGARAILFLEYNPIYDEFLKSIGRLTFRLYEYSNNPADLYRAYQNVELALKTKDNKIFRSEILTSEFANDNEFTLFKYLNPKEKIKEITRKKHLNSYTYQLDEPTYDIDYEIIDEIITKKNNRIKLNVYSNGTEYFFNINSLGIVHSKEQDSLIADWRKKLESNKIKLHEVKFNELIINQIINTLKTKAEFKGLDSNSVTKLEDFLKKIKYDGDLEKINTINFRLSRISDDFRINEALLREENYVSITFIDQKGREIDFSKYENFKTSASFEFKNLKRLSIRPYSSFKMSYFQNIESIRKVFKEKVDVIFQDEFGGSNLKNEILNYLEFVIREEGVIEIKSIKIKFTKSEFNYWITLNNKEIRGSKENSYFKLNRIKVKKLLKHNNFTLNEEYIF